MLLADAPTNYLPTTHLIPTNSTLRVSGGGQPWPKDSLHSDASGPADECVRKHTKQLNVYYNYDDNSHWCLLIVSKQLHTCKRDNKDIVRDIVTSNDAL